MPAQCLVDLVAPDGVAHQVERFVVRRLEHDAHDVAQERGDLRPGIHVVGAVLAAGPAESDAAEVSLIGQDADIGEPLRADGDCIGLVLDEQRDILGEQLLRGVVPVIQVRMGHDDGVDVCQDVLDGEGQVNQRVAQGAAVGVLEAGIGAFAGQHGIDQECGAGVGDLDGRIADLLQLDLFLGGGLRLRRDGGGGKAQGQRQGAGERFDLHGWLHDVAEWWRTCILDAAGQGQQWPE
ncbi:Uncharacterised protein [Bordetella pertussis]|nr:Uncharacterised protein [Bordetella pertussis]